jgi:plastocyanin
MFGKQPNLRRLGSLALCLGLLAAAPGARAESLVIAQEGKKFDHPDVTIKLHDSVVFTNKDPITHNVYSDSPGMAFDLRTQKSGESSEVKFDNAGDAEVHCAIHPQMKMLVHVRP